jgi:peptidoglycan/xylan/chitin deacetylase (PgdA/CDA1 family)
MQALPILMYHHVSSAPGLVTLAPETFRRHMAALANAGWRGAGLDEVEKFFRGEQLPERTCIITFDDGYLDNFLNAHPILSEYGLKAVLFVVTGWVGDGPVRSSVERTLDHTECVKQVRAGQPDGAMVRWSEIEEMQSAGTFEFHSHTDTHTRWDRDVTDPVRRKDALACDLAQSRATLQRRLGCCSRHLCWPQGYYDRDYISIAQSCGFDHLYTTEIKVNVPSTPVSQIGRFVAKEKDGKWLLSRTRMYARPLLGAIYSRLRGL